MHDGDKLRSLTEPGSDALMDEEVMDKIRGRIISDDVDQEREDAAFEKWYDDNKRDLELSREE